MINKLLLTTLLTTAATLTFASQPEPVDTHNETFGSVEFDSYIESQVLKSTDYRIVLENDRDMASFLRFLGYDDMAKDLLSEFVDSVTKDSIRAAATNKAHDYSNGSAGYLKQETVVTGWISLGDYDADNKRYLITWDTVADELNRNENSGMRNWPVIQNPLDSERRVNPEFEYAIDDKTTSSLALNFETQAEAEQWTKNNTSRSSRRVKFQMSLSPVRFETKLDSLGRDKIVVKFKPKQFALVDFDRKKILRYWDLTER